MRGLSLSGMIEEPTLNCPERKGVIRVVLVDDHAMVRQGLKMVLQTYPYFEVVGEACNGEEALRSVREFSSAFEIDPFELRQWAFAQMVLGAWWTFDESPTLYDDQVAKADIWGV